MFRPYRSGLSVTRPGSWRIHPAFLSGLLWYTPVRGAYRVNASNVNGGFIDIGPNHYATQLVSIGDAVMDRSGSALAVVGDPIIADQIKVAAPSVTGAHSVMGWARPWQRDPSHTAGNPMQIIRHVKDAGHYNSSLLIYTNGQIYAQFSVGGSFQSAISSPLGSAMSASTWRHYAYTYDGALLTAYLDSQIVAQVAASGTPDEADIQSWYIGRDNVLGNSRSAMYRDCAVWTRGLSHADVALAYRNRSLLMDAVQYPSIGGGGGLVDAAGGGGGGVVLLGPPIVPGGDYEGAPTAIRGIADVSI